jgi:hypothetical protein
MSKVDWNKRMRDGGTAVLVGVVILLVTDMFWTQLGTELGPAIVCFGFCLIALSLDNR